jgi:hypothetical protein
VGSDAHRAIDAATARLAALEAERDTLREQVRVLQNAMSEMNAWYQVVSAPDTKRKYYRCPVCSIAWWGDENERHERWCRVPMMQAALRATAPQEADDGS